MKTCLVSRAPKLRTKYIQSYQDLYFLTLCYCQDIFKNTSLDFGQKGIPGPGIQLMNPEANAHSVASDDDTSKCFIFCSFPGKEKLDNFAGQIPLSHWVVEKLMEKLENVPQQNLNSQDFGIWKSRRDKTWSFKRQLGHYLQTLRCLHQELTSTAKIHPNIWCRDDKVEVPYPTSNILEKTWKNDKKRTWLVCLGNAGCTWELDIIQKTSLLESKGNLETLAV